MRNERTDAEEAPLEILYVDEAVEDQQKKGCPSRCAAHATAKSSRPTSSPPFSEKRALEPLPLRANRE
jgi:hypothetical protein